MVLRESLIQLLHHKPISRITIKELCGCADVNRATFYNHYTDQFDLLKNIESEFIENINSYLDSFVLEVRETDLLQMVTKIFEYIARNSELCRVLLGENGDIDFQTNIMRVISERVIFEWQKKKSVDEATIEYIYTYVATGSIGIVRKWLFDTNPEPPRKMAEFVARLVNKGIGIFIV